MKCILPLSADKVIRWHRLRRGGAPRSESKSDDRRGRSHHNITAISRPVVSPTGKQRRRKAPTMQYRTLYGIIRRYNVETWCILQHRNPGGCVTVLLKKLQRWRADNIRPYELKNFEPSAKYAPGSMRYVCVRGGLPYERQWKKKTIDRPL